jgi:hypothetical protein
MKPDLLFFRVVPFPMSSLYILSRRKDEGGPSQLLFPNAKPHDWSERGGVEAGQEEGINKGQVLEWDE